MGAGCRSFRQSNIGIRLAELACSVSFIARFFSQGMRPLLRFGGHVTLAGMFGTIFAQSDTLIGAKLLGSELFGFYR